MHILQVLTAIHTNILLFIDLIFIVYIFYFIRYLSYSVFHCLQNIPLSCFLVFYLLWFRGITLNGIIAATEIKYKVKLQKLMSERVWRTKNAPKFHLA